MILLLRKFRLLNVYRYVVTRALLFANCPDSEELLFTIRYDIFILCLKWRLGPTSDEAPPTLDTAAAITIKPVAAVPPSPPWYRLVRCRTYHHHHHHGTTPVAAASQTFGHPSNTTLPAMHHRCHVQPPRHTPLMPLQYHLLHLFCLNTFTTMATPRLMSYQCTTFTTTIPPLSLPHCHRSLRTPRPIPPCRTAPQANTTAPPPPLSHCHN